MLSAALPEVGLAMDEAQGCHLDANVGAIAPASALVLHFEDDGSAAGLEIEPWVLEQFEYFRRLLSGRFSEAKHGKARLPCRRQVFETLLMLARRHWRPSTICLPLRMEVLHFADMVSATEVVKELADSIRIDYLCEGDGARDSAVSVLCELASLLTPTAPSAQPAPSSATRSTGAQLAPATPSPAAVWLVAAAAVTPAPMPAAANSTAAPRSGGAGDHAQQQGAQSEPNDPLIELREACLEALPPWTRQRFAEKPQLWRLELEDVLDVYGAEASPRAESSWLALHAARRLSHDILPFASADGEVVVRLVQENPAMVRTRCVSLCIRELPFSKAVSGFGGTEYQIQVALSPGRGGGWVLGVGGQGLCALRKVVLEIEGKEGTERHELEFTGLMEHASGRQEDAVLGFASGVQRTPLPFSATLMIMEYPLHLAVQTYIGLNFNTMAMLYQGFDFGPMDLACVMDLWLQSDQLRRVPEAEISDVLQRTLSFVKLSWAPVVRVSFVVCMHSCWMQAGHAWWHSSLIRSCLELEVWRGPAEGEPGAGTFRSYITQIIQHALVPYPEVFLTALQNYVEALPVITLASIEAFFTSAPASISDPVAVVARHYLQLLRAEESGEAVAEAPRTPTRRSSRIRESCITVAALTELLEGFRRLVGPPLERGSSRTAVLAFLALSALCDLRHQRRLCAESLGALMTIEGRVPDSQEARFWAGCLFVFLEFARTLTEGGGESAEEEEEASRGHVGSRDV